MTLPLLYGNRDSGHSYKVRLFLALAGIAHDYVALDLAVPRAERPEPFRRASRFGEVPVLVTGDATLCQSDAILTYLAERTGRFGADSPAGWDEIRQWLFWEANRIGFSVPNLRFARRVATDTPAEVLRWLEARARADLDRLEEELARRDFLAGESPSIADIACAAYLWWLDEAGLTPLRWPAVQAWLGRLAALPGWRHPSELMAG
ncbi:glutathione S-transferase family protein [Inquilinus sp. OTU3971]|uniref:glutathione S-transferase family protein n=1 Tax=Inquilinus sp. OTU3971 TaxID=3043855 RepID=UPI00313A7C0E